MHLTLKEYELLRKLMENQNIVLTRDQLLEEIWGYDFDGETRTVDVHVRTLRQKLGQAGEYIETVRGVGYRIGEIVCEIEIQKSMIFVVTMSLLISYILVTLVIYRQALDIRRSELVQEADYIRAAIEISGEEYLGTMDKVSRRTRVTWIDKDGKVLYDTGNDQETLANHKSRPEVKEALANGSGQDIRMSDSNRTGDVLLCVEDG